MISNNEITLSANNRYFLHTPVQCNDETGKRQTQSVLIDNITDGSLWNMNTEKLKCSLLSSSSQQYTSVNQISAEKKGASLSSGNIEQCRSVSVYADASKKKVISGYITLDDYKKVDPAAVLKTPGSIPLTPGATPEPTKNQGNPTPSVATPGPTPGASPSPTPSITPVATPGPAQKEGFSTLINETQDYPPGTQKYYNSFPSRDLMMEKSKESELLERRGGGKGLEILRISEEPVVPPNETDLLETNAFHKIKNNSIIRFYFVSLFVIFIYILHRMSKKLIR